MRPYRSLLAALILSALVAAGPLWAEESMTIKVAHPSPVTLVTGDLVVGNTGCEDRLLVGANITESPTTGICPPVAGATAKMVVQIGAAFNVMDVQNVAGVSMLSFPAAGLPVTLGSPTFTSPGTVTFYGNVRYNHDGMTMVSVGTPAAGASLAGPTLISPPVCPPATCGYGSPTTVGPVALPAGYTRVIASGLWDNNNFNTWIFRGAPKVELKDQAGNILRTVKAQAYARNFGGYSNNSGNPNLESFYLMTTVFNNVAGGAGVSAVQLDLYGCDNSAAGGSTFCNQPTTYQNVSLTTENSAPVGTTNCPNNPGCTEY